ncbi:MAG TPA: hypothetical protein VLG16_01635 [Candidatus Saccharimonadales bacterium]|nr:hypothetical protein [Candidatus Saccharimonadales bacterium]
MSASPEYSPTQFELPSHDPSQFTPGTFAERATGLKDHFYSRSVSRFPLPENADGNDESLIIGAYVAKGALVGVSVGIEKAAYQETDGHPAPRIHEPEGTQYFPSLSKAEIARLQSYSDTEKPFTNKLVVPPEERSSRLVEIPEAADVIARTDPTHTLFIIGPDMLKDRHRRVATHEQIYEKLRLTTQTTEEGRHNNQLFVDQFRHRRYSTASDVQYFYEQFVEASVSLQPTQAHDGLNAVMRARNFEPALMATNFNLGALALNPIMPYAGWLADKFDYHGGGEYEAAKRAELRNAVRAIDERGVKLICAVGLDDDNMGYLDYFSQAEGARGAQMLVVNELSPEELPYTRDTLHVKGELTETLPALAAAIEGKKAAGREA